MQGWTRGVIYGVLKCIESQRLKPSQTRSHDNALAHCFNMAWRFPTPTLAIVLFPYHDFCHAGFICLTLFGSFSKIVVRSFRKNNVRWDPENLTVICNLSKRIHTKIKNFICKRMIRRKRNWWPEEDAGVMSLFLAGRNHYLAKLLIFSTLS